MIAILLAHLVAPTVLTVGDGKTYQRIEDAVAAAVPGSTIEVYPRKDGYPKTAIRIQKKSITLTAKGAIKLDGAGFEYSGDGQIPRAIIQIEPGGEGSRVLGFELVGAHNTSHNGAGIRVNAANKVRIEGCDIHGNDMGIMSNGVPGNAHACEDLKILNSKIHENGDFGEPGQNHNLYLGGTSVSVVSCDIYGALTGHNLKSRAHFLSVEECHIHGGNNRQLDLVDAWDTERPNSNVVVLRSNIGMNPEAEGNRNCIHFGQEKGLRNGTLFLIDSKITSPFSSPVISMDTPKGQISLQRCMFGTGPGGKHALVGVLNGALLSSITGFGNVIAPQFDVSGTKLSDLDTSPRKPSFVDGEGKRHVIKAG